GARVRSDERTEDRAAQVRGDTLMEGAMMNQTAKKIRSGWLGLAAALTTALLGGAGHAVETNSAVGGLSNAGGEERGTARVMGMDATYVGVADGADSIQWNPAGLGHLDAAEVGWHHL